MISVDEEMAGSLKDYGDRYGVGDDSLQVRFTENPGVSVSIEAADLEWFLHRLNPRQATSADMAPAVLVKACAACLSTATTRQLNHRWGQGDKYVPERWSDADVALLVKAHGRSASPLDLRPLGVQDSLGKAVMSTLSS